MDNTPSRTGPPCPILVGMRWTTVLVILLGSSILPSPVLAEAEDDKTQQEKQMLITLGDYTFDPKESPSGITTDPLFLEDEEVLELQFVSPLANARIQAIRAEYALTLEADIGPNRYLEMVPSDELQRLEREYPGLLLEHVSHLRWIIQFQRPLKPDEATVLKQEFGLELRHYVHENAYIERTKQSTIFQIEKRHPALYRAHHPFAEEFKRYASTLPKDGLEKHSLIRRRVVLFEGVDPIDYRAQLELLGPRLKVLGEVDGTEFGMPSSVEIELPGYLILPVLNNSNVRWIEEMPEPVQDDASTSGMIQSGAPAVTTIWDQRIHGENQVIAIHDMGRLDYDHCWFKHPGRSRPGDQHRKVLAARGENVSDHATYCAGIAVGRDFDEKHEDIDRGIAWEAKVVSIDIREGHRTRGAARRWNMLDGLKEAGSRGATIHSNSWHFPANEPGAYDGNAMAVDAFTFKNEEHLVVASAGNRNTLQGSPGIAKNALSVSATCEFPCQMAYGNGEQGPFGKRRKPDIMAPGCNVRSAVASRRCLIGVTDVVAGSRQSTCSTSWATAAVAGAAALVRQYYTDVWSSRWAPTKPRRPPSGALLKATLLNATVDVTGTPEACEGGNPASCCRDQGEIEGRLRSYPSDVEGWGLVRLETALYFGDCASQKDGQCRRNLWVEDVWNETGFEDRTARSFDVEVVSGDTPLKVTLVWTDSRGVPGAIPTKNDLDLIVLDPQGTRFPGNRFGEDRQSQALAPADRANNVEQVLRHAPTTGIWRILVRPHRLLNRPQGFALVVTGDLPDPEDASREASTSGSPRP